MPPRPHNPRPRAFTLIELLVVIVIIALLVSVLLVGLRAAFTTATGVANQQAARALDMAVQQFKTDNGFLPPLAYDGDPLPTAPPSAIRDGIPSAYEYPDPPGNERGFPVVQVKKQNASDPDIRFVAAYNTSKDADFLRGGKDSAGSDALTLNFAAADTGHISDPRYSKFSLPIYLSGVLGREVDGRDGAGITQPFQDGTFAGVTGEGSPRPVDALVEPTNEILDISQTYADDIEAGEHTGNQNATAAGGRPFATAYIDRYGRAFRYYRWLPGRNSVDAANQNEIGRSGRAKDLNVPFVLSDAIAYAQQAGAIAPPTGLDPEEVDVTGGNADLRRAEYAIVGAGPDGLFGTEARRQLDVAGVAGSEEDMTRRRADAMADNVVVYGQ